MASGGAGRSPTPYQMHQQSSAAAQQMELLRKQRKCVSCGNTAMGKCDFRSCGTCCARARNPCQVHGGKHPSFADTSVARPQQQYQWPAGVSNMNMMQYMRQPTSMPYVNPGLMNNNLPFRYYPNSNTAKMPTPPVQTEASKALQAEKAKRAYVQAQRDAQMVNRWRLLKLREHAEGERVFADEAFDRYLRNACWLEEALMLESEDLEVGLLESIAVDSEVADAVRARYDSEPKRKEQRLKLQRVVAKALQKLRNDDEMMESVQEIREFNQGRRDTKRMKVQTQDGKERLKQINTWEDLFQGISSISDSTGISLFLDAYKEAFGYDLGHSLSHLSRRRKPVRSGLESSAGVPSQEPASESEKENLMREKQGQDREKSETAATEHLQVPEKIDSGTGSDQVAKRLETIGDEQGSSEKIGAAQRVSLRKMVTAVIKQEREDPFRMELDEKGLQRICKESDACTLEAL